MIAARDCDVRSTEAERLAANHQPAIATCKARKQSG